MSDFRLSVSGKNRREKKGAKPNDLPITVRRTRFLPIGVVGRCSTAAVLCGEPQYVYVIGKESGAGQNVVLAPRSSHGPSLRMRAWLLQVQRCSLWSLSPFSSLSPLRGRVRAILWLTRFSAITANRCRS